MVVVVIAIISIVDQNLPDTDTHTQSRNSRDTRRKEN